jgi:enoyl-CoA hydratase/carnithine racemase
VLEAHEAADLGLVTEVHPVEAFEERADALVEEIASGPTVALRLDKRLLTGADETPLEEALEDEAMAMARVADTEDHREGVAAFRERRDPEFVGR